MLLILWLFDRDVIFGRHNLLLKAQRLAAIKTEFVVLQKAA